MEIKYQLYHVTNPYDMNIVVKFVDGVAFYFTETGTPLDETLGWSGTCIQDNYPKPSWDI